ncbi:MAG: YceI family protein [Nitrospirae bacterium]|nr:YceI family protein [Nitrospirota bacterium]
MKFFSQSTLLAVTFSLLALGPSHDALAEMARWNVDHAHSTVGFQVTHMVISKTSGKFTEYSGFIEMDSVTQKVKAIETIIQTKSVFTDHQKRDKHLRSPDFFDVEKFPTMTYRMKSYKKTGDTFTAVGDLTLLGITKEITLVGTMNGVAKDPWGNTRAGFTGEGTINRKDYGMKFSGTLDNGGLLVGDEVTIKLEMEVIKEKLPAMKTKKG